MKKFGPDVNHVIDCRELNTEKITRHKAMILSRQYHTACPRLFPLAPTNLVDYKEMNFHILLNFDKGIKFTVSEPGMRIELYPSKCAGVFTDDVITHQTFTNEEEEKLLQQIQETAAEITQSKFMNILFSQISIM